MKMEVHRLRLVVPSTLYMVVVVLVLLVLVVRAGVTAVIDRRMMVAMDTTFDISLASQTFNLSSSCECKMRCLVLPSCISWSLVITPSAGSNNNNNTTRDNSECRISNQGPEDLALTVQTHAVYGYKLSGIKSDIGVITGPDNLLYMKSSLYLTLQGMRDHCKKIPGFRLVILKTPVQFKFAKEYLATVAPGALLDLVKTASNTLQWGDGTMMSTQHQSTYIKSLGRHYYYLFQFRLSQDYAIDYAAVEGRRQFVCQGKEIMFW